MTSSPPLRIALNATAAVTGGGMTYWLNLLPALARLDSPHEFDVLYGEVQNKIRIALPENFRFHMISFGWPRVLRRLTWEQTGLVRWLRGSGIDALLAPADVVPLRSPCPVVMAIRNPTPHYGPRASTGIGRWRLRALRELTRLSAARAHHVYFVSVDSQRRLASSLRIPLAKTSVIYHGIGRPFLEAASAAAEAPGRSGRRPYVLSVSPVNSNKDFSTLIRAFAGSLRTCEALAGHELVIAGKIIDPPYFERLRALVQELGIGDSVSFVGEVAYDELPSLYRGAALFVLPSLAETFGHPLVEAMVSGVPVLTTDLEIMHEICGDAVGYFEPANVDDLAAKIGGAIQDPQLRSARIRAGRERASLYSWERSARETLALLESAARSPAREAGSPAIDSP